MANQPNFIVKKMLQKNFEICDCYFGMFLNKQEASLWEILKIFKKENIKITKERIVNNGRSWNEYVLEKDICGEKYVLIRNASLFNSFKNETKTNKAFAEFYNSDNFLSFQNQLTIYPEVKTPTN